MVPPKPNLGSSLSKPSPTGFVRGICSTNSILRGYMSPEEILDEELCPSVVIKLGKKEYRLAFSMGSVLAFKRATGRNMFVKAGWEGFNLRDDPDSILAFFWAALQTYHSDISLEKAAKMANFGNMSLIADKCNEALMAFLPTPEEDANPRKEPTKKAQSIGSGTGV